MTRSSPLYAITDSQLLPGERLFTAVAEALEGGCRWVQYRDKSNDKTRRLKDAERLLRLCDDQGADLIINDDLALAHHMGAGLHLGQDDGSPMEARALLGPEAILGVTCHASLALARQALAEGASYLAFGRFFPSLTKPEAPPAPLNLLREARQEWPRTVLVAIGGITVENGPAVLSAGADMLAISHSLFSSGAVRQRAEAFAALRDALS